MSYYAMNSPNGLEEYLHQPYSQKEDPGNEVTRASSHVGKILFYHYDGLNCASLRTPLLLRRHFWLMRLYYRHGMQEDKLRTFYGAKSSTLNIWCSSRLFVTNKKERTKI